MDSPGVLSGRVKTRATVDQSIVPFAGPLLKTRRSNDHPSIVRTRVSVSSKAASPDQAIDTLVLARTAAMLSYSVAYSQSLIHPGSTPNGHIDLIAHFQERRNTGAVQC